jgi:hypothetical protein
MKPCRRNVVLILGFASFLAVASGLTLRLHLATVADPHHHNSAHCSLCQTMLGNGMKLHLDPQFAVVFFTADFVESIPETDVVFPRWFTSVVLSPRPPPIRTA